MKNQKRKLISRKLSSYVLIGIAAFSTEYASFLLLMLATSVLPVSQTISFILGLLVSFYGNRNITFVKNGNYTHTRRSQFMRYALLAVCNLLLTNILIYYLVDVIGIDPAIAKILVMGSVVAWNYVIFSKLIFRTK